MTLRIAPGLASLRKEATVEIVRRAIEAMREHEDFRVVHFNVLGNHLHFSTSSSRLIAPPRLRAVCRG